MKRTAVLILLLLSSSPVFAQIVPGTNPISYVWIATPCESWNCAVSALTIANGDAYVFSLPTNSLQSPWVVVRRVVAGSVYLPPDNLWDVEKFDTTEGALSRYGCITEDHSPILITAMGPAPLVISLKEPGPQKKHAVRH